MTAYEERHIDRCPNCGGWRWRTYCATCSAGDRKGSIIQTATPPYSAYCMACGATWEARNARGKDHPTDSTLDREAEQHWATCSGRRQ